MNRKKSKVTTIYLVDDEKLFCQALKQLLVSFKGFKVIGFSPCATLHLDEIKKAKPDIILMDIRLKTENGIDCTKIIKEKLPDTKIIILSQYLNDCLVSLAIKAGASGYITKNLPIEAVKQAINYVKKKDKFFIHKSMNIDIDELIMNLKTTGQGSELSNREKDILVLIAQEYSTKDIAEIFSISEKTVRNHKSNIMKKLYLENDAALIKYAYHMAII